MVNYWYTSGDDRSLDFVRDISKYVEKLADSIIWSPRFVTWACPHCDDDFKRQNCVSDGKYCAMRHDEKLKISGRELIMEDLRQHCLAESAQDWDSGIITDKHERADTAKMVRDLFYPPQALYFEYMKRSHQLFIDRVDEHESYKLMDQMNLNTTLIKACVADTFTGSNYAVNDNIILKAAAEDWAALGSQLYPQMVINGMTFKGRLTADNVFEAICASFKVEPRKCHEFQKKHHLPTPHLVSNSLTNRAVFMIILVLFVVNLIIIFAYRSYLNKELDKDMKIQVSSAVSQYVALSQVPELQNKE